MNDKTYWRVRFAIRGGHVHCRLFSTNNPKGTWAKCGDFVTRKGAEFRDLLAGFQAAEFIPEDGEEYGIAKGIEP